MSDHIFPRKDAEFNTYLGIVAPYLTTNATRLNVFAGNVADLAALKAIWDTKYPQSQSENTATKTIIEEKTEAREDAEELLRIIYGDIPQSVLTTADRNTLNLKERKPNTPRPHITTTPNISLKALGSGIMKFEFRVVGDESRPSIHPDADGIQINAVILPAGSPPPASAEDLDGFFKSRARFEQQLNLSKLGQILYVFARWVNNTDDTKSGGWTTTPVSLMIS